MKHVRLSSMCRKIKVLVDNVFGKNANLVTPLIIGGFNVLYPFQIEGLSANVLVRLPCPDQAVFPTEKTLAEAATAAFIRRHTQLPTPKVFHHGVDADVGPFIIIEDLGSRRGMGQALEVPREDPNDAPILHPDISEIKLKGLYVKMARCMLQLAQPIFSCIGALVETDPELAKQGRISTFGFSEDNWSAFSKHTKAKKPANVLIDENDEVLGAIDWEFAYIAPTQFVLDSPWWLLLDMPEMWDSGIEDWASIYESRLDTWILAMEEAEQDMNPGSLLLPAWSFDSIYWKYLDKKFFGERRKDTSVEELWKTRVHLLSEQERTAMETLVQTKMEESKERILVEWDAEEVRQRLSSFLFDYFLTHEFYFSTYRVLARVCLSLESAT
ncbi:hypothetical protein LCI18_005025 [Fusarium solani-melongenae]|uniref:Uncharacterized protein n=1 Tax=Fusarium solani subsp. cucurbitae TaxID=2747967 RepID=A0ACD3YYY7_FUSSC|nr:hypothetical protein LCI18_005025 [Fusarium solani-melongenae]